MTGPFGDFYKAYGNMFSIYIQDSWTITNRLTIHFGVRAESEYIPSYATGNPDFENWKPIQFDLGDKIAPRLGLVWDVKSDSALKVFGSYGIFYNAMSGTPTSTEWAMDYSGYMPYGRADQARALFLWFANFYVEYNLKLGKNNLNINLNVDNVFDVKTAQRIYPVYNQGAVAISEERIAQGPWDINDYEPVLDPRYLMEADFYPPLTARFGLKFSF